MDVLSFSGTCSAAGSVVPKVERNGFVVSQGKVGIGTNAPMGVLDAVGKVYLGPNHDWEVDSDGHLNWGSLLSLGWPKDQAGGINFLKSAGGSNHSVALGSFDDGAIYLQPGTLGIYVYGANGYFRMTGIATPPSPAAAGMIYYDSSGAFCVYVDGAWTKLAGSGSCS